MAAIGPLDRRTVRSRCIQCTRRKIKVSNASTLSRSFPNADLLRLILTRSSAKVDLLVDIALRKSRNVSHRPLPRRQMWCLSMSQLNPHALPHARP